MGYCDVKDHSVDGKVVKCKECRKWVCMQHSREVLDSSFVNPFADISRKCQNC